MSEPGARQTQAPTPPPNAADGGSARLVRFEVLKSARCWALGEPGAATREIWIACHGYAQLAARFARRLEPLTAPERVVLAPEGLHRFYLDPIDRPATERRLGASWMTREDREHDILDYVRWLDRVAGGALAAAPNARLVGLGFSQGAATIVRWAVATAFPIARLVLWGSGLPPDLDWGRAAPRLRKIPLLYVLGARDPFATPARIEAEESVLRARGLAWETVRDEAGHEVVAETLRAVGERVSAAIARGGGAGGDASINA